MLYIHTYRGQDLIKYAQFHSFCCFHQCNGTSKKTRPKCKCNVHKQGHVDIYHMLKDWGGTTNSHEYPWHRGMRTAVSTWGFPLNGAVPHVHEHRQIPALIRRSTASICELAKRLTFHLDVKWFLLVKHVFTKWWIEFLYELTLNNMQWACQWC